MNPASSIQHPASQSEPPPPRPDAVTLTDSPELFALKRQYRQLDEWHEAVKSWPESMVRQVELERICNVKADLVQRVRALGHGAANRS